MYICVYGCVVVGGWTWCQAMISNLTALGKKLFFSLVVRIVLYRLTEGSGGGEGELGFKVLQEIKTIIHKKKIMYSTAVLR